MAQTSSGWPPGLLDRIWFYVDFDCNLSCSYCVSNSEPRTGRPRLDLVSFRALVDEAVAMGFRQAAVSGGEPFLHPDILPMLEYVGSRVDTIVLTNGTLFGSRRLRGLRELSRQRLAVQVSLDSAGPDLNDLHRGRGCWERAVAGLGLLLEWGFRVTIRATVTEQSESDLAELRGFLRGLGIPDERCYTMPVAIGGRSREGVDRSFRDLPPEPTVAADGLYWHPLKVDPDLAVARDILPLEPSLREMARRAEGAGPPSTATGYR